jgi:single-stranded DNA-binding protein
MIDVLLAGRLFGAATARTSKAGKPYCTGKVRVSTRDGEAVFVTFICFEKPVVQALLALRDGDSVALVGEATPTAWQPNDGGAARAGLDVVVHQALSAYEVARRRKAVRDASAQQGARPADFDPDLNDDLSGVA